MEKKYIFNNAANNSNNFFVNLFKKYFDNSPLYETKKKPEKKYIYTVTKKEDTFKSPLFDKNYIPSNKDLAAAWKQFNKHLTDYYRYTATPSCDFYIGDTPVKVHGNYIQVGATLIPKFADDNFFSAFTTETKKDVYKVIINIDATFVL